MPYPLTVVLSTHGCARLNYSIPGATTSNAPARTGVLTGVLYPKRTLSWCLREVFAFQRKLRLIVVDQCSVSYMF